MRKPNTILHLRYLWKPVFPPCCICISYTKKSFVYDFCKSAKVILTHQLCLPRQAPALHCSLCQWAGRTGRSCPSCSLSTDLAASRGRCTEETAGHFYPLLSSPGDSQTNTGTLKHATVLRSCISAYFAAVTHFHSQKKTHGHHHRLMHEPKYLNTKLVHDMILNV